MTNSFLVVDDFCPEVEAVRESALQSGFGTWRPNKGEVGSSVYEGMNFWGLHSLMLRALSVSIGGASVFPNNMFFRVTRPETEAAYIHSDRMWGTHTCVAYLSRHDEVSGTGFYRHRASGMVEMPTLEDMVAGGVMDQMKQDMVKGADEDWEQLDFVRGRFNRALIFSAPLFHSRVPRHGLGTSDETGRLVWACHFVIGGNHG